MPTGIASAANTDTAVVHIQVRDFMFFSSSLREWRFGLPGAESAMRTCNKFKRRSGGGIPSHGSAPAREDNLVRSVRGHKQITRYRTVAQGSTVYSNLPQVVGVSHVSERWGARRNQSLQIGHCTVLPNHRRLRDQVAVVIKELAKPCDLAEVVDVVS